MMELKHLILFCFVYLSVCAIEQSGDVSESTLFGTLLNRIESLEANEEVLRVEIEALKVENEVLKKEVHTLHHRANAQEQRIELVRAQQLRAQKQKKAKFESVQEVLSTIQTEARNTDNVKDIHTENLDVVTATDGSKTKRDSNRIRRVANEILVAFFATLTHHLTHVGSGQSLEFDNVVTNVGNAYNSHVGLFVAAVNGIYVFSVTLMGYGHHTTHYTVNTNKDVISNIYVRGNETLNPTSSQTFVLVLQQGDDVSIRNVDADESLHGLNYTTFAGFLLQEYDQVSTIVGK